MKKRSYYYVNAITFYRLLSSPFLVYLVFTGNELLFSWLLALSFFTDAIDGFLARRFKVTSVFGSRLDSISDDLTIVAGITGVFVLRMEFIRDNIYIVAGLLVLMVVQNAAALIKYRKTTSFHTIFAKIAAVLQGSFLILIFFLPEPLYPLFYFASVVTALDLIEEIIMVFILPEWIPDIKGLYQAMKIKREQVTSGQQKSPPVKEG